MNAVAYIVAGLGEPLIGYLIRHSAQPVEILGGAGQMTLAVQENTGLVFFLVSGFALAGAVLARFVNR